MNFFYKYTIYKLLFLFVLFFCFFNICHAQSLGDMIKGVGTREKILKSEIAIQQEAGFDPNVGIVGTLSTVITTFLSVLGIIFVSLIVYGGYLWMTARGDEGAVEKAKKLITQAIIGLVIVVAAYSITYFVFNYLVDMDAKP